MQRGLIKGDWENLEGKVVVFSEYVGSTCMVGDSGSILDLREGTVFALTGSVDMARVHTARRLPFDRKPAPFASRSDVVRVQNDLLFTGEFDDFEGCVEANKRGFSKYAERLEGQIIGRLPITYKDIDPSTRGDYITGTYINPILQAALEGNLVALNTLSRDFKRFSKGSPIAEDVSDLCYEVQQDTSNPNTALIEAYIGKIVVFANEQYEQAPLKIVEIQRLRDRNI